MNIFQCQHCAHLVFFENTYCENCGRNLGFLPSENILLSATKESGENFKFSGKKYSYCKNHQYRVCNWLVLVEDTDGFCTACKLNRTIPNLNDKENKRLWLLLENAKHRLIYSLLRLHLPLKSKKESADGLAFDFLNSTPEHQVMTGHASGLITINIQEANAAYREKLRREMSEKYRTVLGHFRHEVGHYYWEILIASSPERLEKFRSFFGDEHRDYSKALKSHYKNGAPQDWQKNYVSPYAASHAWEDWAETWAHYLHLIDTLETAYAFGLQISPKLDKNQSMQMQANFDPYKEPDFNKILEADLPLTFAVNSINRSMGQPDLYPFVLPNPVVEKLSFIHELINQ